MFTGLKKPLVDSSPLGCLSRFLMGPFDYTPEIGRKSKTYCHQMAMKGAKLQFMLKQHSWWHALTEV